MISVKSVGGLNHWEGWLLTCHTGTIYDKFARSKQVLPDIP